MIEKDTPQGGTAMRGAMTNGCVRWTPILPAALVEDSAKTGSRSKSGPSRESGAEPAPAEAICK